MRWQRGGGGGKELKFSIQTTRSRSHSTIRSCVAALRLSMPSCKGPTGQI